MVKCETSLLKTSIARLKSGCRLNAMGGMWLHREPDQVNAMQSVLLKRLCLGYAARQ